MEILVVGTGTMGAQIVAEYAVGGHQVTTLTRRPRAAAAKVDTALASLIQLGLRSAGEIAKARSRITSGDFASRIGEFDLIVESLPEDFDVTCEIIAPLARANPDATIASNTSSLSIVAIGQAIGAPTVRAALMI